MMVVDRNSAPSNSSKKGTALQARMANRKSMARGRAKSRLEMEEIRKSGTGAKDSVRRDKVAQGGNIYQQAPKPDSPAMKFFKKTGTDKVLIREALSKNYIFSDLSYVQLKPLVKAFERIKVEEKEAIITQGDDGDYFYIVESGEVQFEVNGTVVGKAGQGASFGELALIYSSPRAATVRTLTKGSVFRVDQQTFRTILVTQAEASEAAKIAIIKNIDFLKKLSNGDIKKLCSVMSPRMFEKGEVLQKRGEQEAFFILEEGEVISKNRTLGPGDCFGKGALITSKVDECPTVTSSKKGMAFTITRDLFRTTIGDVGELVTKAKDSETLANVQCLKPASLNPHQLDSLARLVRDKDYPKGKRFMKEGIPLVNVLYFVRRGTITVTYRGKSEEIGAGAIIGLEPLETQGNLCIKPNIKSALYSAKCKEDCVIGLLALKKCRKVFDTTLLGDEHDDVEEGKSPEPQVSKFTPPEKSGTAQSLSKDRAIIRKSLTEQVRVKIKATDVPLEKLKKHSILGEGNFGQVWLVSEEKADHTLQTYALKIQSKYDLVEEDQAETILKEKEIMSTLQHPFILQLVKTYQDKDFVYMLLELVQGGELFSIISTDEVPVLPEASSKFYALGISEALSFMHSKDIASRDLKPENVLIDREGYPIIIDFGFAKQFTGKSYTLCGTP